MIMETETTTLHFDLAHLPAGTELWLSAGEHEYPLTAHTDETRLEARAANRAVGLVPDERITHYVRDLSLPARSPQILTVHSPSRIGGKLPTMELTHVHLPRAARRRSVELMRGHREHPAQRRPFAKLADHGVAPEAIDDPVIIDVHDWVTAMDAAVTLIFFHLEMMTLEPETAAIVHLQIEYSNGISDLAASILKQARAHARDPDVHNYVYEGSYLDPFTMQPNGEPAYLWTEQTSTWARGPMLSSLRDTNNDPALESTEARAGTWSVQQGSTWTGVGGAQEAELRAGPEAVAEGWALKNLTAGHGLSVGDLKWNGTDLHLQLKNQWLRWLTVYVQFLDASGQPYDPPDWKPVAPGPDAKTKKYIGVMASAPTILAIPLPAPYVDIGFPMPAGAAQVNYFAGGLGRVNGIAGVGKWDGDVCVYGTAMTAIFNLGIPTIGMVAGFSISLSELNAIGKMVFKDVVVALRLMFTESAASDSLRSGDKGMWLALANSLVMATITASPVLASWIIAQFSGAAATKAAPIIGWTATAVSMAADAALLVQTTVAVVQSPATFTLTAGRKMHIDVTMLPDARHQNQWPAVATHFRLSTQYAPADLASGSSGFVYNAMYDDNGTRTQDFPMTVLEGPIHLVLKDAPAGGTLTVIASFYSNTNWLAGHYKSDPITAIPEANNTLVIPPFNITEELVPLNAETYYAPKFELVYQDGAHQWSSGRFDIRDDVAVLSSDLNAKRVTPALQGAFLRDGKVVLPSTDQVVITATHGGSGDQWLITGATACYHVHLIRPGGAPVFLEVMPGNAGTVSDLSGSNVGHNIARLAKITLNQDSLCLGYTWQGSGQEIPLVTGGAVYPGQMFTFQDVSAGGHPEARLKFVPAGFPTRPVLVYDLYGVAGAGAFTFYVDPRADQYHVRKVDLDQPGTFDLSPGRSYGRFNEQIDGAAVHPNGYLVGFNTANAKLEVLPLLQAPVADSDASLANLYCGRGSRSGLLQNPAGIAVTPDGKVLVLENATETSPARVQALDYLADPVNAFAGGTSAQLALREDGAKATHLDIATEVGGYFYVLKYLDEGVRVSDYRLDIYSPDGTFVSQTVAVNGAKMAVSLWREMFTLNFTHFAGPNGRTEPSVSGWIPSTPQGTTATRQAAVEVVP